MKRHAKPCAVRKKRAVMLHNKIIKKKKICGGDNLKYTINYWGFNEKVVIVMAFIVILCVLSNKVFTSSFASPNKHVRQNIIFLFLGEGTEPQSNDKPEQRSGQE